VTADNDRGRPATVHVIVTCANRKNRPIPAELQLGNVGGRSFAERARRWIARLAKGTLAPHAVAADLYAGEHWSVARRFPELGLSGETVRLWACSAGYGLIPATAPVMPYHATLTPGQADSVPGDSAAWWSELSQWTGPEPSLTRSIKALVAEDAGAVFLLVLSRNYLNACGPDVAAARAYIGEAGQLMIVSAGTRPQGDLADLMIPADARLQARFGGTRRALNARIGGHLLSTGIRNAAEATEHMKRLLAEQPPVPRYDRLKQSDREILDRIAERLGREPGASANRLLREFRDAGIACEQHRFSRLFRTLADARL
jgi:hypothetical protein